MPLQARPRRVRADARLHIAVRQRAYVLHIATLHFKHSLRIAKRNSWKDMQAESMQGAQAMQ